MRRSRCSAGSSRRIERSPMSGSSDLVGVALLERIAGQQPADRIAVGRQDERRVRAGSHRERRPVPRVGGARELAGSAAPTARPAAPAGTSARAAAGRWWWRCRRADSRASRARSWAISIVDAALRVQSASGVRRRSRRSRATRADGAREGVEVRSAQRSQTPPRREDAHEPARPHRVVADAQRGTAPGLTDGAVSSPMSVRDASPSPRSLTSGRAATGTRSRRARRAGARRARRARRSSSRSSAPVTSSPRSSSATAGPPARLWTVTTVEPCQSQRCANTPAGSFSSRRLGPARARARRGVRGPAA